MAGIFKRYAMTIWGGLSRLVARHCFGHGTPIYIAEYGATPGLFSYLQVGFEFAVAEKNTIRELVRSIDPNSSIVTMFPFDRYFQANPENVK